MPKWTGHEGAKKIPGAARARFTAINPHQNWPPRHATQQAASKAISSWAPRIEGSGQGHSPERPTRTNNERQLQACQEKFDQAFSAPSRPARRGGNEGAGFVLSGRALVESRSKRNRHAAFRGAPPVAASARTIYVNFFIDEPAEVGAVAQAHQQPCDADLLKGLYKVSSRLARHGESDARVFLCARYAIRRSDPPAYPDVRNRSRHDAIKISAHAVGDFAWLLAVPDGGDHNQLVTSHRTKSDSPVG
jgi:hypothetical protein